MDYHFKNRGGHVEVYDANGNFLFSADNMIEARKELVEYEQVDNAA